MHAKKTPKKASTTPTPKGGLGLVKSSEFKNSQKKDICAWISEAKSLVSYCRSNAIGYSTVMEWLAADSAFAENYARARDESGHADADRVTDLQERLLRGEITAEIARVAIDAAKWSAGKRQPKRYGDKLDVNATVTGDIRIIVGGDTA